MKSQTIIILFLVLAFIVRSAQAQSLGELNGVDISNYNSVSNKFVDYYNNNQYNYIFEMFSDEMKKASPSGSITDFFAGLKKTNGNIISKEYVKTNTPWVIFKVKFEGSIYSLKIALDNENKVSGLNIEQFTQETLPAIERNTTKLWLPFTGEWYVVWGGDTKGQNNHIDNQSQKNAFDFVIMDNLGKSHTSEGKINEDYYAFNQPILSPCEASVVMVVDGVKDNIPGKLNPYLATGNTVVLKTKNNEFIILAHFKQHSIVVKEGDTLAPGDLLGYCGNSGNSSEPHLHMHLQNIEDMNMATGVKTYFNKIVVNDILESDYSPVRDERIKNNE